MLATLDGQSNTQIGGSFDLTYQQNRWVKPSLVYIRRVCNGPHFRVLILCISSRANE